jgi:hypothetical protein
MTTELRYDRSMIDKPIVLDTVVFDGDKIAAFLDAVGEIEAPADAHGPYAPPMMGMAFVGELPDIGLRWGTKGFMAGQVYWPIEPIRPGDAITTTSYLRDVYEKTGRSGHLVFVVWETELVNQRGETVARCRRSFVRQE